MYKVITHIQGVKPASDKKKTCMIDFFFKYTYYPYVLNKKYIILKK